MIGLPVHLDVLARLYTAATGKQTSASHLKGCGERGHNLLKLINVEIGFTREHDRPPPLWFQPKATPDGEIRLMDYYGRKELGEQDLERELVEYYEERGWDPADSCPTQEKAAELGLSDIRSKFQTLP
jgi:aldehyde:ferredoxin oxidoreductase